jgi:hypothetical protein
MPMARGGVAAADIWTQAMNEPSLLQAQALDYSVWQVFLADPTFLALNVGTIVLVVALVWVVRRRYARFYKIQRESLDHRKSTDAQVMAQQQSFEQLVARHYDATNAHNQRLLAKAEEALALNADTLAQIASMNRTLTRIAERLDQAGGTAA